MDALPRPMGFLGKDPHWEPDLLAGISHPTADILPHDAGLGSQVVPSLLTLQGSVLGRWDHLSQGHRVPLALKPQSPYISPKQKSLTALPLATLTTSSSSSPRLKLPGFHLKFPVPTPKNSTQLCQLASGFLTAPESPDSLYTTTTSLASLLPFPRREIEDSLK